MILNCDIHCHSGYSGGVGKISFDKLYENLKLKGINIYGSADVLHPLWRESLKEALIEKEEGFFILKNYQNFIKNNNIINYQKDNANKFYSVRDENFLNKEFIPRIVLQTEIVLTAPYYFDIKKRKIAHIIVLFPSFKVAEECAKILDKFGVKLSIGRPFIKFETISQLEDFFENLVIRYPDIEIIPAHIFTPDGVLGGENPIESLEQFFGSFTYKIHALESGLSADPDMILSIENLNKYAVISNSDAHSEALNRIGREFFAIELSDMGYHNFISAIREKKIVYSVEFKPEHGRYYLTGHREDRHINNRAIFYNYEDVPQDFICPICHKKMVQGVEYRVNLLLQKNKNLKNLRRQKFYYSIPLMDIISSIKVYSVKSIKIKQIYAKIIDKIGFESNLYMIDEKEFIKRIENIDIDDRVKKALYSIKKEKFKFDPPGFDGHYGKLIVDLS
ncbi:MAG: endonuclease Q family protein [Exilispira sp.]